MISKAQKWKVRLFGSLEVTSPLGEKVKFRTRSVGMLLAYLVLNEDRVASKLVLKDLLWPDSEADKQAQNFRKALSDLRSAIGNERSPLLVERDVVYLDSDLIDADTTRFRSLSNDGLRMPRFEILAEAVSLYHNELLIDSEDAWIYRYRLEFEEILGQAIGQLCAVASDSGQLHESIRIARKALTISPTREDIHIAIMQSYQRLGSESEAIRQFEVLEQMLDDHWGVAPSEAAIKALQGPVSPRSPATSKVPTLFEPSGGAVPLNSPFYVVRETDGYLEAGLENRETVVLIQGPRQTGKSSLLIRGLAGARERGARAVFSDFQALGSQHLADAQRLYTCLANDLSSQLSCPLNVKDLWKDWLSPNLNFEVLIETLIRSSETQIIWGIDEVDQLFGMPYSTDFFGLLRSWHNRRAFEPDGVWSKLTLVLAYASEAHLFIEDPSQSPFNIGLRLEARDFSSQETADLLLQFGFDEPILHARTHNLTRGHPHLTRIAARYLQNGGNIESLEVTALSWSGPFSDHLRHVLNLVSNNANLQAEVESLLETGSVSSLRSKFDLWAAGLVRLESGAVQFRLPIYEDFLRSHLLGVNVPLSK